MSHSISQTNPADLTTKQLTSELDGFAELGSKVAHRMAVILTELRERNQSHPFFYHPVLRFFEGIASHNLDAEAAITLGNSAMIKAVMPLSLKEQRAVASGQTVPVARLENDGSVKHEHIPIQRMSPSAMRLAFGPEGIRPISEQAKIIKSENKTERHGVITVLADECALKIGNQKIKPEDLRGPLAALGYSLDLTRNVPAEVD